MEHKDWLKKADEDLDTAKFNITGGKISSGIFFLQQSAEKSLKAMYIKKFKTLFRTHDLEILAKRLKAPRQILEYCSELNPAYQYTRYPDIPQQKDINLRINDFIKYTEEIIKWVKKSI